jgi:hypothetical protein
MSTSLIFQQLGIAFVLGLLGGLAILYFWP